MSRTEKEAEKEEKEAEEEEEEEGWGLGAAQDGLGGCYGRLQALVHHPPPTHPQAKATRTLKTPRDPHHAFMIKLKITIMVGGSFKTRLIGFLFLKGTMRLIHWAGRVPLADA